MVLIYFQVYLNKMKINKQIVEKHGLKIEEYTNIKKLLKREPNLLELGIFSAMWNEHCSYKSSRKHLKNLPTKGKQVIQGPGENAVTSCFTLSSMSKILFTLIFAFDLIFLTTPLGIIFSFSIASAAANSISSQIEYLL